MNTPVWVVREVSARKDYTLLITFADGSIKCYDARPLLEKPIYAPLKNLSFFLSARAECGTVVWSDDVDISPEHLYECSQPRYNAETEAAMQEARDIMSGKIQAKCYQSIREMFADLDADCDDRPCSDLS
jgi:hypothetical protein